MGYKREKVYKLVFDGEHELAGLEARVSAVSLRDFFLLERITEGETPDEFESLDDAVRFVFDKLGESLVSWNMEKEGVAIPPSVDAVYDQDREFVFLLSSAWLKALRTVSHPLPKPSTNTSEGSTDETSLEEMMAEIPSQSIPEPPSS